jgi:hypothetical protein
MRLRQSNSNSHVSGIIQLLQVDNKLGGNALYGWVLQQLVRLVFAKNRGVRPSQKKN